MSVFRTCVGQRNSLYPVEGVNTLLIWHPWPLNIGWSLVSSKRSDSTLVLLPGTLPVLLVLTQKAYIVGAVACVSFHMVQSQVNPVSSTAQTLDSTLCITHLTLHQLLGMVYQDGRCGRIFITFVSLLTVKEDVNSAKKTLQPLTKKLFLCPLSLIQPMKQSIC